MEGAGTGPMNTAGTETSITEITSTTGMAATAAARREKHSLFGGGERRGDVRSIFGADKKIYLKTEVF